MSFTDEELERYARHIVLREIGGAGQKSLSAAKVAVIGAGGLGSPALLYLAAAGVGTLGVVDDDTVSLSNLQRQVLHRTASVGALKTGSSTETIAAINPHVGVVEHALRLDDENASEIIGRYDLVLDGSDNFATRFLVNKACVHHAIPLVSGAITQWEGQVSLFHPTNDGPCYACIFPSAPADGLAPSCAEAGVMGAIAGIVGSIMAAEAIKVITGAGKPLQGDMLIFDALWGESRKVSLKRRTDCPICGQS